MFPTWKDCSELRHQLLFGYPRKVLQGSGAAGERGEIVQHLDARENVKEMKLQGDSSVRNS